MNRKPDDARDEAEMFVGTLAAVVRFFPQGFGAEQQKLAALVRECAKAAMQCAEEFITERNAMK